MNLSDKTKTYEKEVFKPVIPGSEIRGMLRSNFEMLTNSCMSVLESDEVLSKRTTQNFSPGLLKKRKGADGNYVFDLVKAQDCLWRTKGANSTQDESEWQQSYSNRKCYIQDDFKEGEKVYFKYVSRTTGKRRAKPLAMMVSDEKNPKRQREGYIIKGEDSPAGKQSKHCCHIFTLENGEKKVLENISLKSLQRCLVKYRENSKDSAKAAYAEYSKEFENFKTNKNENENTYFPVYYSKLDDEKNHVMLSPACITREVYKHELKDVVGDFASCENSPFCPACSLFGTLGKKAAVASRIRISDMNVIGEGENCYDDIITLPELSSPKLNNMEFYLQRPKDALFWTYDYMIDKNGHVRSWQQIINGRKFYWHQPEVKLPTSVKATKRNMTIRPLKKGVKFTGKLYFDGVTKNELSQLLWLLNCGENSEITEKEHGYKLGAGKPLGMGSVALAVDAVKIRHIEKGDNRILYREEILENGGADAWTDECFEQEIQKEVLPLFRKMTQFDLLKGKNISYPLTKEQMEKRRLDPNAEMEGFKWFTDNHSVGRFATKREQMRFKSYMEAMTPELKKTEEK
jgi:CRISPR-associated protein (TIGR03986 family)